MLDESQHVSDRFATYQLVCAIKGQQGLVIDRYPLGIKLNAGCEMPD